MTTRTAEELGALAERMVYKGARLVTVVHGDGGQLDVGRLLGHLDPQELQGLAVVLAAMVDPEASVGHLLQHVTWDENGLPTAPVAEHRTVRQLARVRLLTTGEAA